MRLDFFMLMLSLVPYKASAWVLIITFMVACLLSLSINITLPFADGGTLARVEVVLMFFGWVFVMSFHLLVAF